MQQSSLVPSRMCVKVWKVGEKPREFAVLDLNKKRKKLAFKGLENHLPEADFQALASSFQTAVTKALSYLEEAAASTPTAPAACIESDSPGTCSSPTLSLGAEGLEPLGNENLEGQREP